jgi:hypothetical protein
MTKKSETPKKNKLNKQEWCAAVVASIAFGGIMALALYGITCLIR